MKILKIELQNINSLKSEQPIVIDFEKESFKDIGLFVITGSTGAGKTTILDAITIALYHSVPRFDNSKEKSLENVVSYGAKDAFCRVTFTNDTVIYEAYWGIRLANKSGIKLKNISEEVSLKNLSTGQILATQKRKLIEEIKAITQLDYQQFLRSVLLAQGKFASFLTAKGPEKGRLLEQITGESIYKKLGQGILEGKNKEIKELEKLLSSINDKDILDEAVKEILHKDEKEKKALIIEIEKERKITEFIVDWYSKNKELTSESKTIAIENEQINNYIRKNKNELDSLVLNVKAEPFKEIIQSIQRTDKICIEKTDQLLKLQKDLAELTPKINTLRIFEKKDISNLDKANNQIKEWTPKLDEVVKLDNQLINDLKNQQTSKENLSNRILSIEDLTKKEKELEELIKKNRKDENDINKDLCEQNFLKEVIPKIATWSKNLTSLNHFKKSIREDTNFIKLKESEVEKTLVVIEKNKRVLNQKATVYEQLEIESKKQIKTLEGNNVTDLIQQKKEVEIKKKDWKILQQLSEVLMKNTLDQKKNTKARQLLVLDNKKNRKTIDSLFMDVTSQEKLVANAERILFLEQSIKNYEKDRQHLIPNEACVLCGSKEHPYVVEVKKSDISKTKNELKSKKEHLQKLTDAKISSEKKEVKINVEIAHLIALEIKFNKEINHVLDKRKELDIVCEITDTTKINKELEVLDTHLQELDTSINLVEKVQKEKDRLASLLTIQSKEIHEVNTENSRFIEKLKNATTEIEAKKKTRIKNKLEGDDIETELKNSLAEFQYKIPTIENTANFIQRIEAAIESFNEKQKEALKLKVVVEKLEYKIALNKKEIDNKLTEKKEFVKIKEEIQASILVKSKQRKHILPTEVSVVEKRNSLEKEVRVFTDKVTLNTKKLQSLLDAKTEKEALRINETKEKEKFVKELSQYNKELENKITNSKFISKEEIEKALLQEEDKLRITKMEERIKENLIQINIKKTSNQQNIEALNKVKNFEMEEQESKQKLEKLQTNHEDSLTRLGEITESFRKDKEIRDRNKRVYLKIDAQEKICTTWKQLFALIGNSKEAFNVYVQRLTLEHLLDLANVHLYNLDKRYSLKMEESYKPKEELNFNLIDHYQTGQARLVDTSSGGEKFIISLALALGLSDLASKNVRIDSLFIDEGFGTLDNHTLEKVISTLETLQSQGKMIGIISHVENLKERISTQIQITKESNGVSTVSIV